MNVGKPNLTLHYENHAWVLKITVYHPPIKNGKNSEKRINKKNNRDEYPDKEIDQKKEDFNKKEDKIKKINVEVNQNYKVSGKIIAKKNYENNKNYAAVEKKLSEAITQMENQNYGRAYDNPVLLALVINDKKRSISAFASWEIKPNESNPGNDDA
jgi:hypothetical protein